MVAAGGDDGGCRLRLLLPLRPLIQLKHHFGTHAGPDHVVKLQDGEQPGDRTVVGHVVKVDDVSRPGHEVAQVCRQLSDPDAERRRTGRERRRVVAVDLAVLPLSQAVYGFGNVLGHAGRAVGAVDKLAGQRLAVALSRREVVVVVVEGGMESSVVRMHARDVIECAKQRGGAGKMLLPLRIAIGLDGVEHAARGAAAILGLQAVHSVGLQLI